MLGQKLLETVFGEETVRQMAADAREDLNQRLDGLLREERERYYQFTDPLLEGTSAASIREAAHDARVAVDTRFPGTITPPALSAPAANATELTEDVQDSFDHGTLRGLFDQLRGTFGQRPGQTGDN